MKLLLVLIVCTLFGASIPLPAQAVVKQYRLNIPRQSLDSALKEFAKQTGLQVARFTDTGAAADVGPISGEYSLEEALKSLLGPEGLSYRVVNERTIAVVDPKDAQVLPAAGANSSSVPTEVGEARSSDSSKSSSSSEDGDQNSKAMPEILVKGSKSLNMDIARTRDDAQPYVIFDRETITASGAANLEDFFRQRLTMNAQMITAGQFGGNNGNRAQINLRGLGTNQTLILVDGHRLASSTLFGMPGQTDLNGLPLAAIERIEVLPNTASGIYGGAATGGVINVVLRRDYSGTELKLSYDNSFRGDSVRRRVDFSSGFNLENGKTNLMIAGSYSDADRLRAQDRDFVQRGRAAILANNPGHFFNAADPVLGATPNIRSADNSNLTLRNGTALNSPVTFIPAGYAGTASDGGAALVANAGRYNLDLAQSAQNISAGGGRQGLVNAPTVESLMLTVRRQFSARVQGFVDIAASNNKGVFPFGNISASYTVAATAPNNPFTQAIRVTFPTAVGDTETRSLSEDRRVIGGVIVQLPAGWQAAADYTWDRSSFSFSQPGGIFPNGPETALIGNGTIDVLRDTSLFPPDLSAFVPSPASITPSRTTLKDSTLRLAGPTVSLPGGKLQISALLEHRDENIGESLQASGSLPVVPSRSQSVDSVYLEAKLPLVSAINERSGLKALELQLAGRHDVYTVQGVTPFAAIGAPVVRTTNKSTSTNPTFGLRYQPVSDLVLRGSYGTGFLPPSVQQLVTNSPFNFAGVLDPLRGNSASGRIVVLFGGNANLQPEESESWSAGVIVTPRFLPRLRLSVDWTRIDKTDNIVTPTAQQVVDNEAFLAGRVTRAPLEPGDPFSVGRILQIDHTAVNLSRTKVEAYDVQLDYNLDVARLGSLDFYTLATWHTHLLTQFVPTAPLVENAGVGGNSFASNPLKFKANAGINWHYRSWTLGWATRYLDSYRLTNTVHVANQGNDGVVPRQIYHDFFVTRRFAGHSDAGVLPAWLLADSELNLGINNVFDERPPYDASFAYLYSPLGDPRLASYSLSFKRNF